MPEFPQLLTKGIKHRIESKVIEKPFVLRFLLSVDLQTFLLLKEHVSLFTSDHGPSREALPEEHVQNLRKALAWRTLLGGSTFKMAVLFLKQEATRNKCIATSNKCLTSSNKKLLETN